jgi:coniferyl-aldehyde dehydrogenase
MHSHTATAPVAATASPGSIAELEQIFAEQHAASRRQPFPDLALRRDRLGRMIALLQSARTGLCAAVAADFGRRSADNTLAFDILPPLNALKYARDNLPRWLRPQRRRCNFPYNLTGARAEVGYIPLGVVGNISPWNFPVTLALCPMGGILAAGNRVMLKPSELTPHTSALLQQLISARFDRDEVAVLTGEADFAAHFSQLPFDHLLFTGSTSVARHIARAAAEGLVPTTLELGGKSPVIVGAAADLDDVAEKLLFAKTLNAGQICLAPDYVLVQRGQREALLEKLQAAAVRLFPAGASSPDYVNIITARHAERQRSLLSQAAADGNRVVPLWPAASAATDEVRCVVPTAVLIDNRASAIMQEEIFGPLLPMLEYSDLDEAIGEILQRPRPLALYYLGRNRADIARLKTDVACGGMVVNDLLFHFLQDDLPFGGIGASGMGNYHGREGFERFSHAKAIYTQAPFDVGSLLRPPYTRRFRFLVNFLLRG